MADKQIKVKIDVEANTEASIAQLKILKKQLKETAAGSDEFKKIYNQIDDLEDKIKSAKGVSADWIDTLESAGGPIGALGAGLNKLKVSTQSFGAALKATGIGLIVGLLGGLTAAFASSDDQMKKFQPLLIGLEKILNGILGAVQPLIDGFIDLATKALPYVSKAFGVVYSAVTAVFQSLGKLGSAVVKLIKGDFSGAWADAKESVTGFVGNYEKGMARFDEGTKKATKTSKEEADKQREILLKKLEAQDKYNEAVLAKLKAQALAETFNEEQKLGVEEAFAKKSFELKNKEIDAKLKLYKKDSVEYKGLQAEKISLEAGYIEQTKSFADQELKIRKENNDAIIDFEVQLAKRLQELDEEKVKKKRETDFEILQGKIDSLTQQNDLLDYDYAQDIERLEAKKLYLEEQKQLELQNKELTEKQRLEIIRKYAKDEQDVDKQVTETKKAETAARIAIQMQYADYIQQFGALIGQVAGDNKDLAIAGIVIEQGAALAKVIISTMAANAAATAAAAPFVANPLTAIPASINLARVILMNNIQGGLSAAGIIAGAIKGISTIRSAKTPGGSGGGSAASGGAGSAMAAPAAPTVAGVQAPQIQTGTGQNPTTQLGQTLTNAQKPLRAYVVSQDIQSQTALDRRTNRAATFSGG